MLHGGDPPWPSRNPPGRPTGHSDVAAGRRCPWPGPRRPGFSPEILQDFKTSSTLATESTQPPSARQGTSQSPTASGLCTRPDGSWRAPDAHPMDGSEQPPMWALLPSFPARRLDSALPATSAILFRQHLAWAVSPAVPSAVPPAVPPCAAPGPPGARQARGAGWPRRRRAVARVQAPAGAGGSGRPPTGSAPPRRQ